MVAAPPTTFRLVCGAGRRLLSAAGVSLVVRVGVGLRPSPGRQLGVSVGSQLLPRPALGRAPSAVNLQRGAPLPARRRAFKPRPVVRVTYTVRKSASVVAFAASSRPSGAQLLRGPEAAMGPVVGLAGAAASIGVAARAVTAARPVLGSRDLAAAAVAGVVTTQSEMNKRQLIFQLSRLLSVLPISAVAFACACSVRDIIGFDSARLANHFVTKGRQSIWTFGTVRDLHNVWLRFMIYLDRHEVDHDGRTFNALDVGEFLAEVDAAARAKGAANQARASAADAKSDADARAVGAPLGPRKRWQDGTHALGGVVSKLKMVNKHFGASIPLAQSLPRLEPGRKARQPTPALTLGIVFRLYEFVNHIAMDPKPCKSKMAHAAVAAGLLFAAFSCNRCEQANSCFFVGESDDGFLHGVLTLDKHPDPLKRKARPFWMRIAGPDGGTAWFSFLKRVLKGVEGGCFVFRDYNGSADGDPDKATGWRNNPLSGPRLVRAIQCVLARVCGLSFADAALWAKHSARHFLMEVSGARGEPAVRAIDIGRWSGSTAQDPDLAPAEMHARRHQLLAGVMPEAYAPLSKVARVCRILGDQMDALASFWASLASGGGVQSVPVNGDFSPMHAWPADPTGV